MVAFPWVQIWSQLWKVVVLFVNSTNVLTVVKWRVAVSKTARKRQTQQKRQKTRTGAVRHATGGMPQ